MTHHKITARNQYSYRLSTNYYKSMNTSKYTYLLYQKYICFQLLGYQGHNGALKLRLSLAVLTIKA